MENQVIDTDLTISGTEENVKWAGFWIRVGAAFVDFFVYLPLVGLNMYNLYYLKSLPLQLIITLILIFYKPFMEYKYGATIGKMAVKIKVVGDNLEPLTLSQSILRFLPWLLSQVFSLYATVLLFQHPDFSTTSGMTEVGLLQNSIISPSINMILSIFMLVSCIVVAFTEKKQGIHDMIAKTYCIYK